MLRKTIRIIIFLAAVFLIDSDGFCVSAEQAFDFQRGCISGCLSRGG